MADVLFAGATPGFTGLYQINVRIPESAPAGGEIPTVVTVAGQASMLVMIAVE